MGTPCTTCGSIHSKAAIEIAEIILGDDVYIFTTYGRKSFCGLADLIDTKTKEHPTAEQETLKKKADAFDAAMRSRDRIIDAAEFPPKGKQ